MLSLRKEWITERPALTVLMLQWLKWFGFSSLICFVHSQSCSGGYYCCHQVTSGTDHDADFKEQPDKLGVQFDEKVRQSNQLSQAPLLQGDAGAAKAATHSS